MPNHYQQATVSPDLPLEQWHLELIEILEDGSWVHQEDVKDGIISQRAFDEAKKAGFIDVEEGSDPEDPETIWYVPDEHSLAGLSVASTKSDTGEGPYYLYGEVGVPDGLVMFLEWLIPQMPGGIKGIEVEYSVTCSKMQPGQFGGGALYITRESTHWTNTGDFLNRMKVDQDEALRKVREMLKERNIPSFGVARLMVLFLKEEHLVGDLLAYLTRMFAAADAEESEGDGPQES